MRRPTKQQYDRALRAYRANASPEEIAAASGLTIEAVDRLMYRGWPAGRGKSRAPELRSFESCAADRLHRTRNAELDWAQNTAEGAAAVSEIRPKSAKTGATIEQAMLTAWAMTVKAEMDKAKSGAPPDLAALVPPPGFLSALRTLRWVRDTSADVRPAELFRFMQGDKDDPGTKSEWDAILADLAELTEEEQEHFAETGEKPRAQQVLPFRRPGA